MSKLKITCMIVSIFALLSVTVYISAVKVKENSVITIDASKVAKENVQVQVFDEGSLVFASYDPTADSTKTMISKLSLADGTVTLLDDELTSNYNDLAINGKDVVVTYPYVSGLANKTKVHSAGTGTGNDLTLTPYTNSKGTFVFDSKGNYCAINCSDNADRKKIQKYKYDTDLESFTSTGSYTLDESAAKIDSIFRGQSDGELLFTDVGGIVYSLNITGTNKGTLKTLSGIAETKGIKVINERLISDKDGIVYTVDTSKTETDTEKPFIKKYKTFADDSELICDAGENRVLVCVDKTIYLLDDDGTATKSYTLKNKPNKLLCAGDYIAAVTYPDATNSAKVETMSLKNDGGVVTFKEFEESDNIFTRDHTGDLNKDSIKAGDEWNIEVNESISADERGKIVTKIVDADGNEEACETSVEGNKITFIFPDMELEAGTYTVVVENLAGVGEDIYGMPVSIKYDFTVIDNGSDDTTSDKIEVATNSSYEITRDNELSFIAGIKPGTSLNDFLNNLVYNTDNGDLSVTSVAGNTMDSGTIGTGCKVELNIVGTGVTDTLYALIYGDVDGDGKITQKDISESEQHMLENSVTTLNKYSVLAMDVNHDNVQNNLDLVFLTRCLSGGYVITQNVE